VLVGCLVAGFAVAAFGKGGQGWEVVKVGVNKNLRGVHFLDKEHGWIVGDKGTILHTSDGCKNWTLLNSSSSAVLRGVDFVDKKKGWIVGGGARIVKGGSMFEGNRMVAQDGIAILHTTDGGKTWKRQRSGVMNFTFWNVDMIDAKKGWIVTGIGKEHPDGHWNVTTDGGKQWRFPPQAYLRPLRPLYDVCFVDAKHGWCVGYRGKITLQGAFVDMLKLEKDGPVLHTSDGGNTWEVQNPGIPVGSFLCGVSFVDEKMGWVVGEKGRIYHTTDSGKTWKQQKSGTKKTLRDVAFLDKKTGCAVGDGGTILTTTDGGKKWKSWSSVTSKDLRAVSFPDKEMCFVVGDKGTALRRKFK
jgi:photosystem II stability/assembly factor-like uncharacterized protein